jgi:glycosyltransferase involved in cell wall biosynthesis
MRMILDVLVEAGRGVDFVGDRPAEDRGYAEALGAQGIGVVIGQEAALGHLLARGGAYRTVWIARPELAERYLPMVRALAVQARVLYDTVDLHWVRFERGSAFDADPEGLRATAERYRRLELANARAADVTIAITEEERQTLLAQDPALAVAVVPNIHPLHPCTTPLAARRDLFFIGGFSHTPNVDAMLYFVREILPLVHRELPQVRLHIVGSAMPEAIRALASPLIEPVGYVPDVTPWLERARVFVAPLRHGAGMKGKVGQSLSHGLPVVTTAVGAEGMGLTHEVDAMIAEDPAAFAEAIRRLYTDDALWSRLSAAGQELIRQRYSKDAVSSMLLSIVD